MKYLVFISLLLILACSTSPEFGSVVDILESQESIEGNEEYLNSPFVAAGDRVYAVGHQDGSFPDLGWHVDGEMGGVWDHPIKLMDGYTLNVSDSDGLDWCLNDAVSFRNFPVGNVHEFEKNDLEINRYQFVPDGVEGLIVIFSIDNNSSEKRNLELSFTGMVDLSPVWLAERLELEDGEDSGSWDDDESAVVTKDGSNNWFTVFGTDSDSSLGDPKCKQDRKGNGVNMAISSEVVIESGSSQIVKYFIAGSYNSQNEAITTFRQLKNDHQSLLSSKIDRYVNIEQSSSLETGDDQFDQMFRWLKYNSDWMIRDVPEVGRGISAGIPDYPWWFGTDGGYTMQGLLASGMHDETLETVELIFSLSQKANGNSGKIMHEASTNGIVFNPGNLNTTPYFIYALWRAFEWTGDQSIIDQYYDDVINGIRWIEEQDEDNNIYPDGPGMMEIHGLDSEMIDVVAYLTKAYQAAANFALIKGNIDLNEEFEAKAQALKKKVNEEWWSPEFGSYADFRSTKAQALKLIDEAIIRADTIDKPWSVEELKETKGTVMNTSNEGVAAYVVHHNWVVNTPLEMGLADSAKALIALETAKKYRNRFGMFVTGIDRDEEQEKAEKWKAFSYVGAVMTLGTGIQAMSEARYGDPNDALDYLKNLQNSFSYALPGSMYEVSPDFGMMCQAWNIYALAVPVVNHLFGIYPAAFQQKVFISPNLPDDWKNVSLSNVKIGDNEVSVSVKTEGNTSTYVINQTKDEWTIQFEYRGDVKATLNGSPVDVNIQTNRSIIQFQGTNNEIVIRR